MLQNSFYTLKNLDFSDKAIIKAIIEINPEHNIFKGHFPGNPVVPGVCIIQLMKEVLEEAFDKKLRLEKGTNIKFLEIINPEINNILEIEQKIISKENGIIKIRSSLFLEKKVFCKFSGEYIVE